MGVTVRTAEIEEAILKGLSEGTPLTVICQEIGIGYSTVMEWQREDAALGIDIARARDAGWDKIAARARRTARGRIEAEDGDSSGDVARDKLIIDTDLKLLAKWDKRYADKTLHGSDPENPLPSGLQITFRQTRALPGPSDPDATD